MSYVTVLLPFSPLIAALAYSVWGNLRRLRRASPKHYGDATRIIIGLLREFPEEWERSSRQTIRHPTGPQVWVANEAYGLSVTLDGSRPAPSNTALHTGIALTEPERKAIWKAWSSVEAEQSRRQSDAEVAAFAKAVLDRYDGGKVVPFNRRA